MGSSSKRMALSNGWYIDVDPGNVGRHEQWFSRGPGPAAQEAPVPGIIQQVFPAYHGVAWYWATFRFQLVCDLHERIDIHFSAVDYQAEVWLNGVHIGNHEGGETPFSFDITTALKRDADNLLAVRVLNPSNEPIDGFVLEEVPHYCKVIPYRVGAAYNHGGIMGPIELRVVPAVYMADVWAQADAASGVVSLVVTIENRLTSAVQGGLTAAIASDTGIGLPDDSASAALELQPGTARPTLTLEVSPPRLWSPDDPFLYRVWARLEVAGADGTTIKHAYSIRCGFREFRVGEDGYFRLNGRRIFVRSSHTTNHFPIGVRLPPTSDMVTRDLYYAKAAGFNAIRFIAGMAYPEQLECCDTLGLLVYEENYAAWALADSPYMAERFTRSAVDMIRRDRNHPSLVIWGLLNENVDDPVSRHAAGLLPMLREHDPTRVIVFNSGRWDGNLAMGSVCNPWTSDWQRLWGAEAEGASSAAARTLDAAPPVGGYYERVGDAHVYPSVPHDWATIDFLRKLGSDGKPVFLSEYGIGSMVDAIRVTRLYEQAGARADLEDAALYRIMAERLVVDWQRYGMDGVYAFPEEMLRDSQRLHARQRLVGLDAIRANPRICGYNLTGTVDQVMAGEGMWTTWREWKPGTLDAIADGLAPLRWCVFVEPLHGYTGRPCTVEVVLANDSVLGPGVYPVRARIVGPSGVVWEHSFAWTIERPWDGTELPLALPVLHENVTLDNIAGTYCLAITMERGGAPAGGRLRFTVSDPPAPLERAQSAWVWGIEPKVQAWLELHTVRCRQFGANDGHVPSIILVGDISIDASDARQWRQLATAIASGAVAVFLAPTAFRRGDDPVGWLPLANKGRCTKPWNWLYHREDVAKRHPIFDGLQAGGIMDWDYYGQIIPTFVFDGQDVPDDTAAATFAVGYGASGYASGLIIGAYRLGRGGFVLSSLRILEHLDLHPAADRLLLNLIRYAASFADPAADAPADIEALLASIGYGEVSAAARAQTAPPNNES